LKLWLSIWVPVLVGVGIGAPATAQTTSATEYNWTVRDVSSDRAVAWSIRKLSNGTDVVQVATRLRTEQPETGYTKTHYGSQATWQFDCANSNVLHIADRFYGIDGKQTQHFPGRPEWVPFSQTGANEPLLRFLCGGASLPSAQQITATTEAAQLWLGGLL
jgi:hypothetical protein